MPIRYAYFKPEFKIITEQKATGEVVEKIIEIGLDDMVAVLVDLETGETSERKNLLTESVEQQRMDCVELNKETNPVLMKYKNHLRCVTGITEIHILEYKGSKSATFTFIETTQCWVRSSGRVFTKQKTKYRLVIKENRKTTLTKDGLMLFSNREMIPFFEKLLKIIGRKYIAHHRGSARLNRLFTKYFFNNSLPVNETYQTMQPERLIQIYRVKQNTKLKDLPWEQSALGSIYRNEIAITAERGRVPAKQGERSVSNVKTSLNRYLLRGDTKKAIDACFFGFSYPKSIKRILLKTNPLEFEYICYKNISLLVEQYGVDKIRNFITNNDGSPNRVTIGNIHIFSLLDIGFNFKQIARIDRLYAEDIVNMQTNLMDNGYFVPFSPNITTYHDRLIETLREVITTTDIDLSSAEQKANREHRLRLAKAYLEVDTSEDIEPYHSGNFIFRSPKKADELRKVGSYLRICVDDDSYLKRFFEGKIGIVLVVKGDDNYVACIELRGNHIVQAKTSTNKEIRKHKAAFKALKSWANHYQYQMSCIDVGGKHTHIGYNNKLLDRARELV